MCPVCMLFVVLPYIWVTPICVVNVVANMMFCVVKYIGLMSHILVWIYQLLVFVNPTLVWCYNTRLQSSPQQLGRITYHLKLSGWHVLWIQTWLWNGRPPRRIIWGAICVTIVLVCVWIVNILWDPGVWWIYHYISAPLGEIHTRPSKSPKIWIYFWLDVTG